MTPWTAACQAPLSMEFSRQEKNTGVSCHFLLQGIFLTQGSNLGLLHYTAGRFFTSYATREACVTLVECKWQAIHPSASYPCGSSHSLNQRRNRSWTATVVWNQDERISCSDKSSFQYCKVEHIKAYRQWRTILKLLKRQTYFYKAKAFVTRTSPPTTSDACFCPASKLFFFLFFLPQTHIYCLWSAVIGNSQTVTN